MFLVARLLVVACALGVEWLAPPDPAGPAGSMLTATDRPLLASLTSWDGVYYLGIAPTGTGPAPSTVLTRTSSSSRCTRWRSGRGGAARRGRATRRRARRERGRGWRRSSSRTRLPGVGSAGTLRSWPTIVALQPGAVAFAMTYSDSLFLLLAVGSLLCAERERAAGCRYPGRARRTDAAPGSVADRAAAPAVRGARRPKATPIVAVGPRRAGGAGGIRALHRWRDRRPVCVAQRAIDLGRWRFPVGVLRRRCAVVGGC